MKWDIPCGPNPLPDCLRCARSWPTAQAQAREALLDWTLVLPHTRIVLSPAATSRLFRSGRPPGRRRGRAPDATACAVTSRRRGRHPGSVSQAGRGVGAAASAGRSMSGCGCCGGDDVGAGEAGPGRAGRWHGGVGPGRRWPQLGVHLPGCTRGGAGCGGPPGTRGSPVTLRASGLHLPNPTGVLPSR